MSGKRHRMNEMRRPYGVVLDEILNAIKQFQVENERLREALKAIANNPYSIFSFDAVNFATETAIKALEEKQNE
jgi:hypothetical protein